MQIYHHPRFKISYQKLPYQLKIKAENRELIFRKNPFDLLLKTHKLHGKLKHQWSFSIDNTYRIIFEFNGSDVIFLEEYEMIEHQMKGKSYENNLSGEVNALLGKMFGRKEIDIGETVTIVAPTNYQIQVLLKQKIPLSKKINLNFSVDPHAKGIEIKREK